MVMMHAFLALVAGFAAMALIVIVFTALLARFAPDWAGPQGKPTPAYTFVNLGYAFLAAVAGGYITAWIASARNGGSANPLPEVLVLAIAVLALGALSALQMRGRQPVSYQLALIALSPIGVIAGGLLRLRILGIL